MADAATSPVQIVEPSTVATDSALVRALTAERDYVNGQIENVRVRLDAMDEATKVLHETVTRTPTEIQLAIGHLREVINEKFESVGTQFKERDTRQEREARDNKVAVDAAFAAQKEAAAKQDESNAKAIDKSEKATAETISKLQDLVDSKVDALAATLADLKSRVDRAESNKEGIHDSRVESRASSSLSLQGLAAAIGLLGFLIVAATFIATH